jgi:hypothetical protein
VELRCRRSLRNLPIPPAETRTRQTTDLAVVLIGTVGWKSENSSDPAIHSDGESPYRTNGFSNGDTRPKHSSIAGYVRLPESLPENTLHFRQVCANRHYFFPVRCFLDAFESFFRSAEAS